MYSPAGPGLFPGEMLPITGPGGVLFISGDTETNCQFADFTWTADVTHLSVERRETTGDEGVPV